MLACNQMQLIEEVKKRPALYSAAHPADRDEKLTLWREVGAAIFDDWDECNKATAYDRVLHLQRKWRSFRDAYSRELRARKTGVRVNKCVYKYFKQLSFLGGFEGSVNDGVEPEQSLIQEDTSAVEFDPLIISTKSERKPKKRKVKTPSVDECRDEEETPLYNLEVGESETDTDKLFLLSFLPEMRQLPVNIKMWARAQIANIMQEAVASQYDNTTPRDRVSIEVKRPRGDSSD
ncbi:uncharacterized protein LOC126376306 [Pectinophora gossypiella]|uniref:uncharacterized protein LOC126376306 n=1 Tax=Pectinophora gossypiella TaxID=13191 RepID=UPI00214E88C6|nr:uncharacterized protein LOC126376306 [Pectinophora gossypiella]XP_049879590.1 uncharacterized protein LOC126376306 [Pectinophora gossypiella]